MADQSPSDELAQQRLHQQIEVRTGEDPASSQPAQSPRSPRQYIEQKMREAAEKRPDEHK